MLKKIVFFILFFGLVPLLASAEECYDETPNAFGFPDKSLITIIESNEAVITEGGTENMPDCNDAGLLAQLKAQLLPYLETGWSNIRERRKIELTLKNIKNFEQLNTAEITPEKDVVAADRLIELKINQKKRASDIKICKVDSKIIGLPVYTLMYYAGKDLIVEVLNFSAKENPQFIFIPKHE